MRASTSHYHDCTEEANPDQKPTTSPLPAGKSLHKKQALASNIKHRVITELRAFLQMSAKSKEGSQDSNKEKTILQETERQRGEIAGVDH